jgi:ubiquinone/menaquinone biosynthesis C-methylase UbiE
MWSGRSRSWHDHVTNTPGFEAVRASVLEACDLRGDESVVDLGAGTGFLAVDLSSRVRGVLAVDIAPAMLEVLREAAKGRGRRIETRVADLRHFDLPAASVDLVVSSYALHHLSDRDKVALLRRARIWLRPGGRLVVADMMFGRGGSARDRAILRQKVASFCRKGPGGLWRMVKACYRYGLKVGAERPASPDFWRQTMIDAGFVGVRFQPLVAEAGLIVGSAPAATQLADACGASEGAKRPA